LVIYCDLEKIKAAAILHFSPVMEKIDGFTGNTITAGNIMNT